MIKSRKLLLLLALFSASGFAAGTQDSARSADSSSAAAGQHEKGENRQEETRKPNYLFPVIAGAVGGILLALWLRRKKG